MDLEDGDCALHAPELQALALESSPAVRDPLPWAWAVEGKWLRGSPISCDSSCTGVCTAAAAALWP